MTTNDLTGATPGGWHVGGKDDTIIFDDATGYAIADAKTFHGKHGGLEVCQANARLMAAAPNLLKACSDWIEWLEPNAPWREDAADHEAKMLDAMRAAIAQATGGHHER